MECLFINVDKDVERRVSIERNFADVTRGDWHLTRFPATTKGDIDALKIEGNISLAERACFYSHRAALLSRIHNIDPILIVEDDVIFHDETFSIVDNMLPTLRPDAWDIIYLDVCIPDVKIMVDLYKGMKAQPTSKHFSLLDLRTFMFAGAAAYIVNGRSKYKISQILGYSRRLDMPYDLYLRHLIHSFQLNALVVFPFISSLSRLADSSTIDSRGEQRHDRVWNQFRRLVWIGRELNSQRQAVDEQFAMLCDDEMKMFAMIVGAALSADLKGA